MTSSLVLLLPIMGALSVLFCWLAGMGLAAVRAPALATVRRSSRRGSRQ